MSYVGMVTDDSSTHLVGSTLYGICDTASNIAEKDVQCENFDELIEGVTIHVKFTNSNTAENPSLNVNGMGSLDIYRYGTTPPSTDAATSWNAGAVVSFTFDGHNWLMNDWQVDQFDLSDRMAKGIYNGAIVEGNIASNKASGNYAHAEGSGTTASNIGAHSEGVSTTASGTASHAEGQSTKAVAGYSHAEGISTTAKGNGAHAEGQGSTADNINAHAEGFSTVASGNAHAEGIRCNATAAASHAEGSDTKASASCAHAEGNHTIASGFNSHASGLCTKASRKSQTAIGEYNVEDTAGSSTSVRGNYAFIIGNGTEDSKRSNALAVKWDGTIVFSNGAELTPEKVSQLLALLNT